jgi:hypothetical protein
MRRETGNDNGRRQIIEEWLIEGSEVGWQVSVLFIWELAEQ